MGKRVLVVDPYMKGLVGHSTGAARRFARGLLDEGATVRVLGPSDAPVDAWDLECELAPVWPASPSLQALQWSKVRLASQAYNLTANRLYASRVRACLVREARSFKPDVVVVQTSMHSDIYALAAAPADLPIIACVHAALPDQRLSRVALSRFAARVNAGDRFAIGTFTDAMGATFAAAGIPAGATIRLHYPYPFVPDREFASPPERFTVEYAGDARAEKGFPLIADAAPLLAREARVLIQCVPPVTGLYDAECERAVEQLRTLQDPNIELIFDILPEKEFAAFIASSSAVLVPYDPTIYTDGRLSGIFNDALPAGIPLVISDGWEFAEEIKRSGAGVVFTYRDTYSLIDAVRRLRDEYGRYLAAARVVAARLAETDPSAESARRIIAFADGDV